MHESTTVVGDDEIANIVDMVLKEDLDGDGYITYAEFALAQRKSKTDNK